MPLPNKLIGPLWILLASLIFSTLGTAQALAPAEAAPQIIGFVRLLGGGLVLFFWCALSKILPTFSVIWRIETLISVVGIVGFQLCFFLSLKEIGVAIGSVTSLGITPIAAGLMCRIFFKESLGYRWLFCTLLAIFGLVLLSLGGESHATSLWGISLAVLAGCFYACYIVAGKNLVPLFPKPESLSMTLSLLSGLCLFPAIFFYPTEWIFTLHGSLIALHYSVLTIAVAFTLLLRGLRDTPGPIGATLTLAEPLCAALLGIFFLQESVSKWSLLGIACMFAALVWLMWPSAEKNELV